VTRVVDFGAFVEVEPGLEGLVHISELADHRVKSAGDAVKPGQDVRVRVIDIDAPGRRMSLSLKRASELAAPGALRRHRLRPRKRRSAPNFAAGWTSDRKARREWALVRLKGASSLRSSESSARFNRSHSLPSNPPKSIWP
jgi:predicted RNA-binding protein with RPS1 domain